MHLRFRGQGNQNGTVLVNGTTNLCPTVASVTALPQTVAVGGTAQINGMATGRRWPAVGADLRLGGYTGRRGHALEQHDCSAGLHWRRAGRGNRYADGSDGDCQDTLAVTVTVSLADLPQAPAQPAKAPLAKASLVKVPPVKALLAKALLAKAPLAKAPLAKAPRARVPLAKARLAKAPRGGPPPTNACLACETVAHDGNNCPSSYNAGLAFIGNSAALTDPVTSAPIPGSGGPRSQLFLNLLDCYHTSKCAGPEGTTRSDRFCGAGVDPNECFAAAYADATGVARRRSQPPPSRSRSASSTTATTIPSSPSGRSTA